MNRGPKPRPVATLLLLASLAAAGACAVAKAPPAAPDAVDVPGAGGIRVDGRTIPARLIWEEYSFQRAVRNIIHGSHTAAVDDVLLTEVIAQCLSSALLSWEAERLGYGLTAAEESTLRPAEVAKWSGEDGYRVALQKLALTEEHQLVRARNAALRHKLAEGEGAFQAPTEEEERRYYDEHAQQFPSREQPHLRYVFRPHAPGVNLHSFYPGFLQEVEDARKRDKTFAGVVARNSAHPSGPGGGVVDESAGERLPFQPAALKPCRVSGESLDDAGLHIYLRDCSRTVPFDQARDRVRELFRKEREDRFLSALLERLQAGARVEYLPLRGPAPFLVPAAGHGEAGQSP